MSNIARDIWPSTRLGAAGARIGVAWRSLGRVVKGHCMTSSSSDAPRDDDIILRTNLRAFAREALKTLEQTVAEIELGRFDETPNMARLIRDLNTARLELLKLENRLSQEANTKSPGDPAGQNGQGAGAIDYEEIRDAIGRRLDRIRNAKAAAKISEQPEQG